MKTNLLKLFMMLFAIGLFVTSCENVDLTEPEVDEETMQDNALSERAVGDVFGYANSGTDGKKLEGCPNITWDMTTPNLMKIDFGTGCTDGGSLRSGVIWAQFSSDSWLPSASTLITFDGYTVDGNTLDGTVSVSYTGTLLNPEFTVIASNMVLTFEDTKTMTWTSSNTFTMEEGFITISDRSDDVWIISGTSSGTARNGKSFTRTASGLTTSTDCKWFVAGTTSLTIGEDVYEMTYSEPCGTVEIIFNGITFTKDLNDF
ncbi:MAG: hypothetical protein JXR51_07515 [Bacteroidales bacterium]|nr:hypothetical protein [Bacteroidales bacterium]MBN2757011.1 hypothetical protein [Bacteroidales bacterium]